MASTKKAVAKLVPEVEKEMEQRMAVSLWEILTEM
jgi:hypothetical protein